MNDKKMEAAVVGAIIGPTISVVLQNLLSLSVEEISNVLGFKKELKRLENSFYMIQDFLSDAEAQQITNKAVKRWLKNLEAVAFDADNVLDEFNYQLLRQKVKTQNQVKKKKIQCFLSGTNSFAFRRKMGKKIKDIKERLEIINQEASGFGLQKGVIVDPNAPTAPVRQQTDSFALDPIVIGRENDVSKIVEMINTCPVEEFVCVIPIVGMGGIGKTTLARLVFNEPKIENDRFKKKIWICVSENFDPTTLFKMILESLTAQSVQVGTREAVLKRLRQNLEGQRYLLVLDDVWNEDNDKWEDFVNSVSGMTSEKGNCIIVTTRSKKVASIVRTLSVHELSGLSDDNCWSIIKAKSFKGQDVPAEFQEVGKCIAQRCQGLPLVAKVIGGLLLNKPKEEWLSILETRLSDFGDDENRVLKVLKLSFDHLPGPSLKKCFAYCAVFPKDFCIEKGQLIKLWMAEGFLQTDRVSDMETLGNKFFIHLFQSSLFQGEHGDDCDITHCEMHDLVHDLACSVSDSRSVYVNDSESTSEAIPRVQHLSVNQVGDQPYNIPKEQARYLRTLFFGCKVSDKMFFDFKCLHSLTLKGEQIEELPNSIGKLVHLRYLGISNTRIKFCPDSMGKLFHLQTLQIKEKNLMLDSKRPLPNSFKNLICLRHLCIPSRVKLPPGIGKLTYLQTLEYFCIGYEKGYHIEELGSLRNLKGELQIQNLERVKDKEEAKRADLFGKPNIISLLLVWNEPREGETIDEDVLEGLQPFQNLSLLDIKGFNGKKLPLWTMKMAVHNEVEGHWLELNNLREVKLSNCYRLEEIPKLGHLPHLKFLSLSRLTSIRYIIDLSFYGIDNCSSNGNVVSQETIVTLFPALENLRLLEMENLTEWVETLVAGDRIVVFPCLKSLLIQDCHQLRSVPHHFPCLERLTFNNIGSGLPLENICNVNLNSLKRLTTIRVSELVKFPDELLVKNQYLSWLRIESCPNLTHVVPRCNGASLTLLSITNCENLRELPDDFYSLKSLQIILIDRCPNLTSISYPEDQSQGFTCLEQLEISNCKEFINFPSAMLKACTSLESVRVYDCPKLTSFQVDLHRMMNLFCLDISQNPELGGLPRGIGSLLRLETLKVGPFSESLSFASFSGTLDGIQGLRSLKSIALYGWERWDSLPDQLQHLSSLLSLEIWDFGIEGLPEWFQNLSSLQYLNLHKCTRLRRLPSKETMQRLTNIRELSINNCPLLKERYDQLQRDDPEWLGISHIPQIYIDEQLIQLLQ